MKVIFILTALLVLLVAQRPNCFVHPQKKQEKIYLMPNELQAYNLADYFEGYNLKYSVESVDNNTYTLIQPFYSTDVQPMPDNITDYTLIDFSIETDGNLAWIQRAAFLAYQNSDKTMFVQSGTLNENLNLEFNNSYRFTNQGNLKCFNVITLSEGKILVDCQIADKATDIMYVIDELDNVTIPYPFTDSVVTNKRKSVAVRLVGDRQKVQGGRTYILSAWIADGTENSTQSNSKIQIYYLNKFVPEHVKTLTAKDFGLTDLKITDIAIDALTNVYITEAKGSLISFSYDGQNFVTGNTWKFDEGLQKVSVHVSPDLSTIIQVISNSQIIEIDLQNNQMKLRYQLPENISEIVTFETNNDLLIVQTKDFYYIYRRYFNQLDHMLATFQSYNSRFVISSRAPNAIFINTQHSVSYIVSEGFIIVRDTQEKQSHLILINATSASFDDSQQVVCQVQFVITSINDPTIIYHKKTFKNESSQESPFYEVYHLDDYFLGTRLEYQVQSQNVTMILMHKDTLQINSDDAPSSAEWFATFSYDVSNYYKLILKDNQLTFQTCAYGGQNINCKTFRKMPFSDTIIYYSFFKATLDKKQEVPVLAYVIESNKHIVKFIQIDNGKVFPQLFVDQTYPITDVDANERYIYVPVRDANKVNIYTNNVNAPLRVWTIDEADIPNKDDDFVFKPMQTMLSPTNINVVMIKNVDSIIIFHVTAFMIQYVSIIPIPHLGYSYISSDVVIGKYSMLVIISSNNTGQPDEIIQYGIYDIYKPVAMRSINLIDKIVARPVDTYTIDKANIIGIKTQDVNGTQFISFIRTQQPQVGSLIDDIQTNGDFISLITTTDSAVVQRISQGQKNLKVNSFTTVRFYYNPTLIVKASRDSNAFKNVLTYSLVVSAINDQFSATKSLSLFNIISKLTQSSATPQQISLPKNSNAAEVTVEFPMDKYFKGPVAKYSIECPYCGNKISLIDHVTEIGLYSSFNAKDFYYFSDKSRVLSLHDGGVIVSDQDIKFIKSFSFNFTNAVNITSLGWAQRDGKLLALISNNNDDVQYFVWISVGGSREDVVFGDLIPITNNPVIQKFQVMKIFGNRIFVLDNQFNTGGKGVIYVFTVLSNDGTTTIVFESKIDYSSFGLVDDSNKINDFEIVKTADPNTLFLILTLSKTGIAYATYDAMETASFNLTNPQYQSFNNDPLISQYQIEGSEYSQLEILALNLDSTTLSFDILLTISNGQHLELNLIFTNQEKGYNFETIKFITSFEKYGQQKVMNWAQALPKRSNAQNFMLVAYQSATNGNRVSLGLYNLNQVTSGGQPMIGAVEHNVSSMTVPYFSALMFSYGNDVRVVVSICDSMNHGNSRLFNLSSKVYMHYKYDQPGDFDTLKIVASNQYNSIARDVKISFDKNPIDPKGLAWYVILLIVLGGLLILGLVLFLIIKYRKKKAISKDSLLSASKQESQDEQF